MTRRIGTLRRLAVLAVAAAALPSARADFPGRDDPSALIGVAAPRLGLDAWALSEPLEIERLRGKVVLVRWWTDRCPFCAASAAPLGALNVKYGDDGLVVIGVFHPKPPGDRSVDRMLGAARRFRFSFPLALDADWSALRRWWLDLGHRWTSVSFLIDKQGLIRYVHPGGEYHEGAGGGHWPDHASCNREYREIDAMIARLLAE